MAKTFAPALIAGVVSALLYLVVFSFGLGFLFLFLPTLPLFWLGMGKDSRRLPLACIIATTLLVIFAGPVSALLVYFATLALPACYISHESMKYGQREQSIIWFPLTVIFARLMTVFCFFLLAATLFYADTEGGLPTLISQNIYNAFSTISADVNQETGDAMKEIAAKFSFLVFAVSAWMWGACLYLHVWIVNREMLRQKIARRPDLGIGMLPPPNWMISLLIITAVASLIGSPSMAFWGKASMIILLFPYFLLGASLLHTRTAKHEYRVLLLFLLYFILATLLWPVLFIAGYGLIYHIQLLNKYLSAGGNSTRS